MSDIILETKNLSVQFGGIKAVNDVNLEVHQGELIGLIGPNGAGKTTIFNLITNSIRPTSGDILFKGKSIVRIPPYKICRLGISRTFQNIRLFPQMTVYENVELGLHSKPQYSLLESFIRTPRAFQKEKAARKRALELLDLVNLCGHAHDKAGSLPYGLQRRLEIARAMATNPGLLLLDEPAAGMNEDECAELIELIRKIHSVMRYSIVLIEHHMHVVMELCRDYRIYVLSLGSLLAHGTPQEIQSNPDVINAYLGTRKTGMAQTGKGGK